MWRDGLPVRLACAGRGRRLRPGDQRLSGTVPGVPTAGTAVAGRYTVGYEDVPSQDMTTVTRHPVRWDRGRPRRISTPVFITATGVNPAGLVIGFAERNAVVWQGGLLTALPATGGSTYVSTALAITDDGRVGGGSSPDPSIALTPTIWTCRRTIA
jgi:uncharacterized membrane protein